MCCERTTSEFGATVPLQARERRNEPFIFVAMPTRGAVAIETHMALTSNVGVAHALASVERKPVVEARNELAAAVLAAVKRDDAPFTPSEYLVLWLDDDAWFPHGLVPQLVGWLRANPLADAVCGFFCPRSEYAAPTAWRGREFVDPQRNCKLGDVVEIDACGFHFVLHRASLLERVGPNPFSLDGIDAATNGAVCISEDIAFCMRARAAGARLYCATGAPVFHVESATGLAYAPGQPACRIVGGQVELAVARATDDRTYGTDVDAAIATAREAEKRRG